MSRQQSVLIALPLVGVQSIVMSMSVCLSVRPHVRNHVNFAKCFVRSVCGSDPVLL